ncbi:hypothetical protein MMC21_001812 [Puttea exsequens]|nr:hypothetical protein [Puttea exsequens]
MVSGRLSIDEFLNRLTTLFESNRKTARGSVFLTQKRRTTIHSVLQETGPDCLVVAPSELPASAADTALPSHSPFTDLHPPHPLPILIRATNGKSREHRKDRIKFSTVVQAVELEGFFSRYADVCKAGMAGLKKRDRSGRKAKAKKKKVKGEVEAEKKGRVET